MGQKRKPDDEMGTSTTSEIKAWKGQAKKNRTLVMMCPVDL